MLITMDHGFRIEITRVSLGDGPANVETVYALAQTQDGARTLVRTAMRLTDEKVEVAGLITPEEAKRLGLKPYQVKHA